MPTTRPRPAARSRKEPIIFLKSLSAFSGPYDDIIIPRGSKKTDWEVELGVVIGTKASLCAGGRGAWTMSPAIAW